MQKTQVVFVTFVLATLICCVLCRSVPEHARVRVRRQFGDMQMGQHRVEIALGQLVPKGCNEYACGLIDVMQRSRRSSADQRVAELQALIALAQGGEGGLVGHGQIDPFSAGKRKRSQGSEVRDLVQSIPYQDSPKARLLRRLVDNLMNGS